MKVKPENTIPSDISDKLPPVLEELKHTSAGMQVPEGYFHSLSPRISDRLAKDKNSFTLSILSRARQPLVVSSALAVALVVMVLFFVIPGKNSSTAEGYDTLKELNMALDATFTEEVLLAESNAIDSEIEISGSHGIETIQFAGMNQLTDVEIADYLKDEEIETELLTEN